MTHLIRLQALLRQKVEDSNTHTIEETYYEADGLVMLIKDKEDEQTYKIKISREKENEV